MEFQILEHVRSTMTNAHVIDYFVITAADLTAILIAWLAGKGWIKRTIKWQRSGKPVLAFLRPDVDMDANKQRQY
jgi:hypothetical protein